MRASVAPALLQPHLCPGGWSHPISGAQSLETSEHVTALDPRGPWPVTSFYRWLEAGGMVGAEEHSDPLSAKAGVH